MTPVTLHLPASLLRRFRTLASEMLVQPEEDGAPLSSLAREAHFHEALVYAVAEEMLVYSGGALEAAPATLQPVLVVHSAVPEAAAGFVEHLAERSGLTLEAAWCRVVLDFCEREQAPALTVDVSEEVAA